MLIVNLPNEIQNKIFYFYATHPCAKIIKDYFNEIKRKFYEQLITNHHYYMFSVLHGDP